MSLLTFGTKHELGRTAHHRLHSHGSKTQIMIMIEVSSTRELDKQAFSGTTPSVTETDVKQASQSVTHLSDESLTPLWIVMYSTLDSDDVLHFG